MVKIRKQNESMNESVGGWDGMDGHKKGGRNGEEKRITVAILAEQNIHLPTKKI